MKNRKHFLPALFLSFVALIITGCGGTQIQEDPDEYVDVLPANNEGNILQAFNWKFTQIKDNLPAIANSGFKVVQTSPVQEAKNGGPNWYSFYQPVAFSISQHSSLGNKAELQELCTEADKYGIRIICDIVFNHLANINDDELEADGTPKVYPDVENYEPEIYAHRNDATNPTFHHNKNATGSGAITQYYAYGGLPDLNTANELVQQRALALLKECIDVGVDGFRFDAAKHIETPDDPQYASDFWPNVLGVAKTYYKNKTGEDLIAYGEILNDVEGGRDISYYTKHMKVTDNGIIAKIASASVKGKADGALEAKYSHNTDPSNIVTWVESHDTFVESTTHVSNRKTARQYAILASKKDSVVMFLARPDNSATVGEISDYFFESEAVAVSNRFHNRFHNYEEYNTADESCYISERYLEGKDDVGALIVSLSGAVQDKTLTLKHLGSGIYYDQLTGNSITVKNGKAKVDIGDDGIMVLTKSKNLPRPEISFSEREKSFVGSLSLTISTKNASSASYKINGGSPVSFNESVTITLNDNTELEVTASNEQFSISRSSSYKKMTIIEGYLNILNINPSYFEIYDFYYWAWGGGSNGIWLNDFTIQNGVILLDFTGKPYTGFLLACFNKGYTIPDINVWDNHLVKQTKDISTKDQFYDASSL